MPSIAIKVENLGKSYRIGHNSVQSERYTALRDVIARNAKSLFRKTQDMLAGEAIIQGDLVEEFWALKEISFEIEQGARIGIIGRNGAGKSTLLKVLSRITDPTKGRIHINGRVASLLEVGTGFHPELSGRENIFLNGAILGMSRSEIRRRFDEIVNFAEVEKFLDTPVKHYSSGMYVRLAFAVAAHLESEILIIDEVLSVGDASFQKKCFGKMEDAGKQGRTVLFVSHNMPTVQLMCEKVIWLSEGRIKSCGKPDILISNYLSDDRKCHKEAIDLSSHPGRTKSREKALKKAWIINSKKARTNSILMGEEISIYFSYKTKTPISNPGFGFGIEDEFGRRIFSLNNYMTGLFSKSESSGVARLNIPRLTLLPGTYFVSLSLVENQVSFIDFVEQAIAIEVGPADVYQSGKIPERNQGVIFIDGTVDFSMERGI